MSHRASLDIQLHHADWKVAEDDDMEGMHLSFPLSLLLKLMANFVVTVSNFTECKRRIGSGRNDAQCRIVHIPCLAGCRYSCLSVPSSPPVIHTIGNYLSI